MSSSIWMQCEVGSELVPLALEAWRAVEAQHQISTRKLVDSDEEQVLLEELIEGSKPPMRSRRRLHYLLATAFRYPPLRHGSRFATRHETSLWYGAEDQRTMFAEVAYYRLLFLEGTAADLGMVETQLTAFSVPISTERGLDLTAGAFADHRDLLASKTSYAQTQTLGAAMRDAGVEAFRYASARDNDGGVNVGVFTASAFASSRPRRLQTWHGVAQRTGVEVTRRDYFSRMTYRFDREMFLVDGRLPIPA